jgi:Ca2+-binding EF-hand superfamily protein
MMRTACRYFAAVSALGLLLMDGPATAQTRPVPDTRIWVKEHDRNGDGNIDREEFQQVVTEAFFFRDKNKNGYLTIGELTEATPEALKAVKRRADGRITLQEYVNALFRDFEAADTDKDGVLTVEEIDIYMSRAK